MVLVLFVRREAAVIISWGWVYCHETHQALPEAQCMHETTPHQGEIQLVLVVVAVVLVIVVVYCNNDYSTYY